jgi:hypothetical protein
VEGLSIARRRVYPALAKIKCKLLLEAGSTVITGLRL